jgi:hypothetical protein
VTTAAEVCITRCGIPTACERRRRLTHQLPPPFNASPPVATERQGCLPQAQRVLAGAAVCTLQLLLAHHLGREVELDAANAHIMHGTVRLRVVPRHGVRAVCVRGWGVGGWVLWLLWRLAVARNAR